MFEKNPKICCQICNNDSLEIKICPFNTANLLNKFVFLIFVKITLLRKLMYYFIVDNRYR